MILSLKWAPSTGNQPHKYMISPQQIQQARDAANKLTEQIRLLNTFLNDIDTLQKNGWAFTNSVQGISFNETVSAPQQTQLTTLYQAMKTNLQTYYSQLP